MSTPAGGQAAAEQQPGADAGATTRFWVRYALTASILSFPLAYGAVILGVSTVAVGAFAVGAGIAILVIWDGLRFLPKSLMFWAKPSALHDDSTGLYNLEAWKRMLAAEDDRCQRYELPATVLLVKLQGRAEDRPTVEEAGRMLQAGTKLGKVTRGHDVVAVLDDDLMGILAVNCPTHHVEAFVGRVRTALDGERIAAAFGYADRETAGTLNDAWSAADAVLAGRQPQSSATAAPTPPPAEPS